MWIAVGNGWFCSTADITLLAIRCMAHLSVSLSGNAGAIELAVLEFATHRCVAGAHAGRRTGVGDGHHPQWQSVTLRYRVGGREATVLNR